MIKHKLGIESDSQDINHSNETEKNLKSEYQTKAILNLVQGLVETDHDLFEAERRIVRKTINQKVSSTVSKNNALASAHETLREYNTTKYDRNKINMKDKEREKLTDKIKRDSETLDTLRGT
jgi:hypothetical protein